MRRGRDPSNTLFRARSRGLGTSAVVGEAFYAVVAAAVAFAADGVTKTIVPHYHRDCAKLEGNAAHKFDRSDDSVRIVVKVDSYWNASGLILEKGVTCRISVKDNNETWKDDTRAATAAGWWPEKGLVLLFVTFAESLIRDPQQRLYHLVGAIYGKCEDGRTCGRLFPIGPRHRVLSPADGECCAFANDLPLMYANNSGSLTIQIKRI